MSRCWRRGVKGGGSMKRLRMGTPTEVRRVLARVSTEVYNGDLDTKTANTIILACNAVLNSLRTDEQQKKLDELERLLNDLQR